MNDIIDVSMGSLCIASAPNQLTTSSIGSCVAVCLYSHADRMGALAHIMLPNRLDSSGPITEEDYKFAEVAFSVMVTEFEKKGIPSNRLISKIVGGANMFPMVQGRSHKIGETNLIRVRELIQQYHIQLAGEETGGNSGRALCFDLSNGIVTIKITI